MSKSIFTAPLAQTTANADRQAGRQTERYVIYALEWVFATSSLTFTKRLRLSGCDRRKNPGRHATLGLACHFDQNATQEVKRRRDATQRNDDHQQSSSRQHTLRHARPPPSATSVRSSVKKLGCCTGLTVAADMWREITLLVKVVVLYGGSEGNILTTILRHLTGRSSSIHLL